jgi:hypothetical protein
MDSKVNAIRAQPTANNHRRAVRQLVLRSFQPRPPQGSNCLTSVGVIRLLASACLTSQIETDKDTQEQSMKTVYQKLVNM